MTELRVGDQLIRFDREATVAAYSAIPRGDADRCTCQGCRNFSIQRKEIYPGAFRDLLNTLGIDWYKEGEAVHYGPKGDGHFYSGWFYFVGEVAEKGESCVNLSEEFKYFIGTSFPRPPAAFGSRVIAVEFWTLLPWLLTEPWDPERDRKLLKAEEILQRYSGALRKLAKSED